MRAAWIPTIAALAMVTLSCGRNDGIGSALEDSFALGESTSAFALEAYRAESQLLASVTFAPFGFRQVRALEAVPATSDTCAVKYQLSPESWGIVPGLLFACSDESAAGKALGEARDRLRSELQRHQEEYEARLEALRGPITSMTSHGPTLAYARSLGVSFDVRSCSRRVSNLLVESATAAAALQLETFLAPGASLEAYRTRLLDTAGRAGGVVTEPPEYPSWALSPEVAGRCGATVATSAVSVPGSVSGTLGTRSVAYPIRLGPGQPVEIQLSSGSFDTELSLYDESCNTRLSSDDDGGGGTNSRIS